MAKINDRIQKQNAKNTAFEKTTGKSHFSPVLRAKRTDIMFSFLKSFAFASRFRS